MGSFRDKYGSLLKAPAQPARPSFRDKYAKLFNEPSAEAASAPQGERLPDQPATSDVSLSFTPQAPGAQLPFVPSISIPSPARSAGLQSALHSIDHPYIPPAGPEQFANAASQAHRLAQELEQNQGVSDPVAGLGTSALKVAGLAPAAISGLINHPIASTLGGVGGGLLGGPAGAAAGAMLGSSLAGGVEQARSEGVAPAVLGAANSVVPIAQNIGESAAEATGPLDFLSKSWRKGALGDALISAPAIVGGTEALRARVPGIVDAVSDLPRTVERANRRAFGAGEDLMTAAKAKRGALKAKRAEAAATEARALERDRAIHAPPSEVPAPPVFPGAPMRQLLGPASDVPVPVQPDLAPPLMTPARGQVTPPRSTGPIFSPGAQFEPGPVELPQTDVPAPPERATPATPEPGQYTPPRVPQAPASPEPPPIPKAPRGEYDLPASTSEKQTEAQYVRRLGNELASALEQVEGVRARRTHSIGEELAGSLGAIEDRRARSTQATGEELAGSLEQLERSRMNATQQRARELKGALDAKDIARMSEAPEVEPPPGDRVRDDAPVFRDQEARIIDERRATSAPPAEPAPLLESPEAPPPAAPRAPAAAGPIWPALPPIDETNRELKAPDRHVNMSDEYLKRSTATGSILGPTSERMAAGGVDVAPGTGGTGLADMAAEHLARSGKIATGFTENVLGGIEKKFPEGSPGDLAAARWIEGKATPEDVALLEQNPDLKAAAERWQKGASEAMADPRFDIKGQIQNYLTHARAKGQPASLLDAIESLERPSGTPELRGQSLKTSYMQRSRAGEGAQTPPSLVRAARAYGQAGAFQLEIKPFLKKAMTFLDTKAPDGSPIFDASDRSFFENWINDAVRGREQFDDARARQSLAKPTALLNKALSTVGLPTVDNPLKSAINGARQTANVLFVRPAAAAVSHFLGDLWPKIAEKGVAGIGEYADGARRAMTSMPDAEWDRIERLGVTSKEAALPSSTFENPVLRGLTTPAKRIIGLTTTVDAISKLGTFYAEEQRLLAKGMPAAQAESMAATITRSRNYYSNAVNSIPKSNERIPSAFYQFLKPGLNGADNIRNWITQGNGGAIVRTGLGVAGLYALGQATGYDFLHRVHLLPHGTTPAIVESAGKIGASLAKGEMPDLTPAFLKLDDPLGIANEDSRKDARLEKARETRAEPETKERNRQAYRERKRRAK